MRGVCQSEPKPRAIFTTLDARRFSVRTEISGDIAQLAREAIVGRNRNSWQIPGNSDYQFEFEVFVSQNPNSWQITNLHARCLSVRAKIPGGFFQFECEALSYQNRSSWRYLPGYVGGVFRAGAKSLAVFTSLIARRFSSRTEIPGVIYRFECEVFVGQGPNAWRRFHV